MLEKELKKVINGVYPFHMPGHKRQKKWTEGLFDLDITEITGADNLHCPKGVLARCARNTANLFGTKNTLLLTGGSTCGILSAITAATRQGEDIIIARNCHKSVYNACIIGGLNTHFVYPLPFADLSCYGEVTPRQIEQKMLETSAKTVVVTSPTYEGVLSDIEGIAEVVHRHDGLLIVDSAHGAHLGFNEYFPKSARSLGADIVIESAHKTLPCITGAALLHVCTARANLTEKIKGQLSVFETSSPPYPILCSIDRFVTAAGKSDLFSDYVRKLEAFYDMVQSLSNLKLISADRFDRGKILISCKNASISGIELKNLLLDTYAIELEMAMPDYALAMTSLADTKEGFDRLAAALKQIDSQYPLGDSKATPAFPPVAQSLLPIFCDFEEELVPTLSCEGRICSEFVFAYPPGSPIIAPGEKISAEILSFISGLKECGTNILSSGGFFPDYLSVFKEKC